MLGKLETIKQTGNENVSVWLSVLARWYMGDLQAITASWPMCARIGSTPKTIPHSLSGVVERWMTKKWTKSYILVWNMWIWMDKWTVCSRVLSLELFSFRVLCWWLSHLKKICILYFCMDFVSWKRCMCAHAKEWWLEGGGDWVYGGRLSWTKGICLEVAVIGCSVALSH